MTNKHLLSTTPLSESSAISDETPSNSENAKTSGSSESNDGTASTDQFPDCSMFLITNEDFSEMAFNDIVVDNDALHKARATKSSHGVRKLLRAFGDSTGAAEIILLANKVCAEKPCTQVLPITSFIKSFPNTSRSALYATRDIQQGEFIIAPVPVMITTPVECGRQCGELRKGNVLYNGLQNDFTHYQTINRDSRKRKRNSNEYLKRRKLRKENSEKTYSYEPDSKYYSEDESELMSKMWDKYDMCIDTSDSTEELKAIRRNCVPNCIIRYVILHQRLELFIVARRDIQAGEELSLDHDYDANLSEKVLQCIHPHDPEKLCLYEKERRTTIANCLRAMNKDGSTDK